MSDRVSVLIVMVIVIGTALLLAYLATAAPCDEQLVVGRGAVARCRLIKGHMGACKPDRKVRL